MPDILERVPKSFFLDIMRVVQDNAALSFDKLLNIPGLQPIMPSGAIYMMVGVDFTLFPNLKDDVQV